MMRNLQRVAGYARVYRTKVSRIYFLKGECGMYTVEELKAAADRLEMMGCELGKTLYEGEGKKFVVLPAFHGDKEKGLAYLV